MSTTFVEPKMTANSLRGVAVLYKATRKHTEECIPFSDAKIEAENLVQRLKRRAAASVGNPKAVLAHELGYCSRQVVDGKLRY